jgi:hypothetical protein
MAEVQHSDFFADSVRRWSGAMKRGETGDILYRGAAVRERRAAAFRAAQAVMEAVDALRLDDLANTRCQGRNVVRLTAA